MENTRRQDVAPDNCQRGRRIFGFRFFDDGVDLFQSIRDPTCVDDAVALGVSTGHVLDAENGATVVVKNVRHLLHDVNVVRIMLLY